MGLIAWIVLGLAAGLLAKMLIPGKRSQGLIITCVTGIAGALPGGWAATWLLHIYSLHGFFNLSTWLTAIARAAALLLAYHLVTGPVRQGARPPAGTGSAADGGQGAPGSPEGAAHGARNASHYPAEAVAAGCGFPGPGTLARPCRPEAVTR
jgi:uncharacterized membrane protein YeaQ/YmgE (transglycosylase-associated protein family)